MIYPSLVKVNFNVPRTKYVKIIMLHSSIRLWTFSINCRNSGDSKTFKGAPFVEVEYDPNCDYVDISNRTDVRSQLINVSYILDVYLPTDKDHRVVSRPKDDKAVFVRSTRGTLYAVNVSNGALLFSFNVGPRLHSHPVRDLSDDVNLDKFWVTSTTGTLYHQLPQRCPHVLNRIVTFAQS